MSKYPIITSGYFGLSFEGQNKFFMHPRHRLMLHPMPNSFRSQIPPISLCRHQIAINCWKVFPEAQSGQSHPLRLIYEVQQEGIFLFFIFWMALLGWAPLRDHPPPKPPFQCPHPNKKGTILLLFEFCIHLHTHQDLELTCCRVMGQKLRHGRPCTRDLPGTHNWLAQSHIASFFPKFH